MGSSSIRAWYLERAARVHVMFMEGYSGEQLGAWSELLIQKAKRIPSHRGASDLLLTLRALNIHHIQHQQEALDQICPRDPLCLTPAVFLRT